MASSREKCLLCSEPCNDEMVQCDRCNQWFHYTCVGVDGNVQYEDWECKKCRQSKKTPEKPLKTPEKPLKTPEKPTKTPEKQDEKAISILDSVTDRNKQLKLARLEEERLAHMKYLQRKYRILIEDESDDEDAKTEDTPIETFQQHFSSMQQTSVHTDMQRADVERETQVPNQNENTAQSDMHRVGVHSGMQRAHIQQDFTAQGDMHHAGEQSEMHRTQACVVCIFSYNFGVMALQKLA